MNLSIDEIIKHVDECFNSESFILNISIKIHIKKTYAL